MPARPRRFLVPDLLHFAIVALAVLVGVLVFWVDAQRRKVSDLVGIVAALSSRVTAIETAAAVRPAEQCHRLHVDELRLKRPRVGPEDEDESNPVIRRR